MTTVVNTKKQSDISIWIRVFISAILIFSAGGTVFGFAALKPVMIDSGVYSELCTNSTKCAEQELKINSIYQIMVSTTNGLTIVMGMALDLLGKNALCLICSILWTLSCLLFGFSNSKTFDFYIPAFCLMGITGNGLWLCYILFAQELPKHTGIINGIITASWDFSSIIFFLFSLLYYHAGASLRLMFCIFSLAGLPLIIFSFFLEPFQFSCKRVNQSKLSEKFKLNNFSKLWTSFKNIIPWKYFFSKVMIVTNIFFCCQLICMYVYMSTILEQLFWISNDESVALMMNNVYSIMLSVIGAIASILLGFLLDKIEPHTSCLILGIMGTAWVSLSVVKIVYLQYFTFIIFLSWRVYIWLIVPFWIMKQFPKEVVGRLYGTSATLGGLISMSSYLINYIIVKYLHKNFFWINIGLGILQVGSTILFGMTAYSQYKKKEEKIMDEEGENKQSLDDKNLLDEERENKVVLAEDDEIL